MTAGTEAVELYRDVVAADRPRSMHGFAASLYLQGHLLTAAGRHTEALDALGEAADAYRWLTSGEAWAADGHADPGAPFVVVVAQAAVLQTLGRADDALRLLESAVEEVTDTADIATSVPEAAVEAVMDYLELCTELDREPRAANALRDALTAQSPLFADEAMAHLRHLLGVPQREREA